MTRPRDVRRAARVLRGLLDRVERGELDAPLGVARGLAGAAAALEAVTARQRRR